MSNRCVLAIDDEPRYLRLMRVNLEAANYRFLGAANGQEALDILGREPVDAILLDVLMPGQDGFALIEEIREFSDVPVIFVTALDDESDKVRGLKLGADDYLTKPFGALELLARVEAVLRRYQHAATESSMVWGPLRIDPAQHRVFRGETEIRLSRTEFRLLSCLLRYAGKVVPQDQLTREVWGPFCDPSFEGLRVYVHRLRQKLEVNPEQPALLVSFPGVGYALSRPGQPGQ